MVAFSAEVGAVGVRAPTATTPSCASVSGSASGHGSYVVSDPGRGSTIPWSKASDGGGTIAHAELGEDRAHVGLTVASLTIREAPISLLVAPRAIWRRTSCSLGQLADARRLGQVAPHVGLKGLEYAGVHPGIEPCRAAGHGRAAEKRSSAEASLRTKPAAPTSRAPTGLVVVGRW